MLRSLLVGILFASTLVGAAIARASDYTVTNSASFFNAIESIDSAPTSSDRIIVGNSFTMSQQVLAITTTGSLTVVGNGNTINGGGAYRPFFVESGNVTLQNLTITSAQAHGGNGAGGGMGAGAAVFVDSSGHLALSNVNFTNNSAIGGNGGSNGSGGGGLGGNGGSGGLRGGGGGLYGNGGYGLGTGGGGGGELGNGGVGMSVPGNGGGGGGTTGNGTDASSGGTGGTQHGGNGGHDGQLGGAGGVGGGGGGSGSFVYGNPGGNGGLFGGGGGAGGQGGRFGGGGGEASGSTAGNGGFGGGGGAPTNYGTGGNGGFGGGGGGGATGGTAGFGGGNGANDVSANGGGGGAGFGGAIFVANGGTITFDDATSFTNNTVTGGTGNSGGGNGSADGYDIFLMRGTTTSFDIASGQTLTFAPAIGNNDGTSNAGVIIDKLGLGTLVLSGASSYSGSTTVDAGTLVVNSTLAGTMTVNSGGTLMGVGTVGDTTVNAGGTIFPGIVGAPLTINGSFVQTTGSTYTAEVSPTASDKIIVNGHASIQNGATFNIALDAGTYSAGTRYVVLTASGGISGTYSTSILPSPGNGLFFALDYEANEIDLLIQSIYNGTHFAAEAQTYNQLQVATALDTISPTATGSMATYITQLEGLSPTQARQAFDQMAGDIYPSIAAIELQTTTAWLQLISNRLASQMPAPLVSDGYYTRRVPRAAAASSNDTPIMTVAYNQPVTGSGEMQQLMTFRRLRPLRWTGWMQGYGLGGAAGSNGNASALSYGLGGTVFGIDRWVGPKTLVGLMGGYANANVGDTLVGGNTSINGYQVGVYGAHRFERWYLQGVTAYSGDNYTTNRQITFPTTPLTAHSSYAGNQFAKYVETGLNLGYGPTVIQPLMGVQYIYLDQQRFNETGAGALNLAVGHQTTNSVRGMLGLRMASEFTHNGRRWMPIAQARWQREWADGTHLVTSSFAGAPTVAFNTAGNTLGRDFGLFTLGSNLMLSQRTSVYGGYDLQTAARYTAHLGSASLQYRW